MPELPEPDLVKTGIAGLDDILNGGIPRGNVILLEGSIGCGKTTLGVEFIYRGAKEFNEPGLIVVFEVSPDKVMRDAARFGWDLRELEQQGKLRIVFTSREVLRQELQQADSVLLEEAAKIGARRIFIDGVAKLVQSNGLPEVRSSFHVFTEGLQRENLTAVLAIEASAFDTTRGTSLPEESIADTVIRVKMEDSERAVTRSLEVVKSRGQSYQMGRHCFRIIDGFGLQVFRRVQAPRRARRDRAGAYDPTTRVTTGVPGLDKIVNGGYFLGSTTVVVGISGSGKSVMALHYLAEGARLGERSLMVSLDEQEDQIIRNANVIGIDLPRAIKSGLTKVIYEPPQEIEVDVHFDRIEKMVEEFKPRRVVIDSLSTYGSNLGSGGRNFRDFFHALVALMKEHQIAAVYNHENPEMLGMGSMMGDFAMSSMVDNIILMNWVELGDTFHQSLTIAKMRANPVSRVTHEVEIIDGKGMRVLPRVLPVSAVKNSFASYASLVGRTPERSREPDRKPKDKARAKSSA